MDIEAINLSDMLHRVADAILTAEYLPGRVEQLKEKINELGYAIESERDRNKELADEISQVRQRNADLVAELTASQAATELVDYEYFEQLDQLHTTTLVIAEKRKLQECFSNALSALHSSLVKLDQLHITFQDVFGAESAPMEKEEPSESDKSIHERYGLESITLIKPELDVDLEEMCEAAAKRRLST